MGELEAIEKVIAENEERKKELDMESNALRKVKKRLEKERTAE
jgi:hypothetical protein